MRKKKSYQKSVVLTLVAAMLTSTVAPVTASAVTLDNSWEMYIVPNSHIDTAWEWPYEDTARDVIKETFSRALGVLKKNPEYKFTASASKHYEWTKEYYPEMYKDIQRLVRNGQWDNPGGQVVEPDLNIPNGEALVRQSLEGQHFFERELGQMSTVGYVPDTFGFCGQFPQILQKSGMDHFVTTKLNWQDTNKARDSDIFKWQALDGESEVLSYVPMRDYVHTYSDGDIKEAIKRNAQSGKDSGVKKGLGLMGGGDHGGGPSEGNYSNVLKQNGSAGVENAQVKMSTITEYFDTVSKDDLSKVRTVEGEMYFEYHRGTYTSWAKVKEYNRKNEILAEKAEKAATLGNWLGVLPNSDTENISKAWDKVLINQFHDVLPGSSIPYQYMVTYNNQELAKNLLDNAQHNGIQAMAYRADTNVSGIPVVVFNSLSWQRDELVEVVLNFEDAVPAEIAVYDGETKLATTVLWSDAKTKKAAVRFAAKDLPSMGFKVFNAVAEESAKSAVTTNLIANGIAYTMENDFIKVEINPLTGNISQIYNKKDNNRKVFADGYEGNEIQILKDTGGSAYPAWDVLKNEMNAAPVAVLNTAPDSIEIVENTPERAVIRISRSWSGSTMSQDIILEADSDRVDVKMNVNWNENQRMMKIAFPFAAQSAQATYEVGYGSLTRPTTRDNSIDGAKFEVSGHKWADITDDNGEYGASILNDSKYGWDALRLKDKDGNYDATRLRLTALRSPKGANVRCAGWDPQPYFIDKTEHNFVYSIYPHAGDWTEAETVQEAAELNYKVEAVQASKHEGTLGRETSFATSSATNVPISVLKTPMDNPNARDELIVRVYEAEGTDNTNVTLTLPGNVISAQEVNLLEHEDPALNKDISISGNQITFDVSKYEIATFKIKLAEFDQAPVDLQSKPVDLFRHYNLDAVSYNEKRKDGNLDGLGNTVPAELWQNKVTFQGVDFKMGPATNGYDNMVQAKGQTIALPKGNYDYVYILGAGAGSGQKDGTFTVNQTDGTAVTKDFTFANWDADLSGWDRFSNSDLHSYVTDQIGTHFTHFHNGTVDRMTVDNYLYVYAIPVDSSAEIDSIVLPDAPGMNIAAISVAQSDYLKKMTVLEKNVAIALDPVQNVSVKIAEDSIGDKAKITWDLMDGIKTYRVYRGVEEDFTVSEGTFVGSVGGTKNTIIDTLPAKGEFVYKVVGTDALSNKTELSTSSNVVVGGLDNAFLTVPQNQITATGSYKNEEPFKACDGNEATKWCYRENGVYLQVDMGESSEWDISKFTLVSAGRESANYIVRDYRILSSDDGVEWNELVNVKGNKENVVESVLKAPVRARYFKLIPDYAAQVESDKNCPRIYEFQAWGSRDVEAVPEARDIVIDIHKDKEDANLVQLEADYTYVKSASKDTEGASLMQWSSSVDGVTFEKIEGATGKMMTLSKEAAMKFAQVSFEVIPVDAKGALGKPVSKKYIVNDSAGNIFAEKRSKTSHQFGDSEAGPMLTDGNLLTKWCADGVSLTDPRTAIIDLKGTYDLSRMVLRHATVAVDEGIPGADSRDRFPEYNTRLYNLYVSDDGVKWTLITEGKNPEGKGITAHDYTEGTVVGRYIKVEVTQGVVFKEDGSPYDGNHCVRMYEVQGYGKLLDFAEAESEDTGDSPVDNVVPENLVIETAQGREPMVGDTLTAAFDVEEKYRPLARYRWLVSDTEDGAYTETASSFTDAFVVGEALAGKWIRVDVKIDKGAVVPSAPIQISTKIVRDQVNLADIENLDGAAGTAFNLPVTVSPFSEGNFRAVEGVVTLPENAKVTDVTSPVVFGEKVTFDWHVDDGVLRFAIMSTDAGVIDFNGGILMNIAMETTTDLAPEAELVTEFTRFRARNNETTTEFDLTGAKSTAKVAAKKVSAMASELYTGDGFDLIPEDKKAVSVIFTGLEAEADVLYGTAQFFHSAERSAVNSQVVYVGLVDKDVTLETLNNVESYTITETGKKEIVFGDYKKDGLNAQDALNVVSAWLRKDDALSGDEALLVMNVNADQRIDTTDAIDIVEKYLDNTNEFKVVTK